MRIRLALILSVVAQAACGGHEVNLGGNTDGGSGSSSGGAGSTSGGGAQSPLSGTWSGYIESFQFPDGSDTVTMVLAADANGSVAGTVTFGNEPPPPPPTDPDVSYPPGYLDMGVAAPSPLLYIEGFHYTVVKPSFDGQRLQLGVITPELWKAWCELQTKIYGSMPDGGGPPYNCLPNWGFMGSPSGCSQPDPSTGQSVPVDCGKLALCGAEPSASGGCQCSATSCTINLDGTPDVSFDMRLSGDHIDGSTSGDTLGAHNVHFTRAP
jgi:hypothetical protein